MGRRNQIRQVWAHNFADEIFLLNRLVQFHNILSIDTEFPGFVKESPWGSIDEQLYEDFRFNVNETKLIQMGLTAMDESGNICGSWEFNFSDFDPETDAHSPSSITFLKDHGLDFDKLKKEGIPMSLFARNFLSIIRNNGVCRWITFHGLYDIGYLMKAMGVVEKLPESMGEFAGIVVREVGIVRDLKHMSRFCEGLQQGRLGLQRLSQLLRQKRFGPKHNAGSDSLLTAMLHTKMFRRFDIEPEICDGFLYGFSHQLEFMDMYRNQTFFIFVHRIPVYHGPCYWFH